MTGSLIRGGGENVSGIPGACATPSFTYLAKGPWFARIVYSKLGAAAVRFVMNSEMSTNMMDAGPGWMHVLDLPGDGTALGCNMPPAGTIGPLIRYSTRSTHSMIFTDDLGK